MRKALTGLVMLLAAEPFIIDKIHSEQVIPKTEQCPLVEKYDSRDYAESMAMLGKQAFEFRFYIDAAGYFRKAVASLDPAVSEHKVVIRACYYGMANCYMKLGDYELMELYTFMGDELDI